MAQQKKLTGSSLVPAAAVAIVGDFDVGPAPFTGATATGATQGTAYQITAVNTRFGTVAAGTGAILPPASVTSPGDEVVITNFGANALALYPQVGGAINNGATNASVNIAANGTTIFKCMDNAGLGWVSK
jgi:hypothetical protein